MIIHNSVNPNSRNVASYLQLFIGVLQNERTSWNGRSFLEVHDLMGE